LGRQQKVNPAAQAGFTLIELLVVTVIMVMAYSLAAPLVSSGVTSTELKASARQLAAGLRKARSEAIARRRETVLTVDLEARRFQISGDQRMYRLPKARSEAIARRRETVLTVDLEARRFQISGDQRMYRLPKDVEVKLFTAQSELINGNAGSIRFYPDGGSTGGRITLTARDRKYGVDVNWLTGQVVILD